MRTIFAQSSKPGKAGVAVFRISGPDSFAALGQLLRIDNSKLEQLASQPRVMHYHKIYDPENGELIDNAMVVYFKSPASFTGEDVVEIHTHGSIAIAKLLTKALLAIENIRFAEAGEFARRAFLNDKFDLTAAEGLADLIEAETIMQHRQATRQFGGALEQLYSSWRSELLSIISLLEAYIDFPDEDIPEEVLTHVQGDLDNLKASITSHLKDSRRGELLRNGLTLTILGEPNVGKSSLLNFLLQREVAIVSDIAGTTRDIIEGHLDIGGYPIILQDTAGIRSGTNDLIEQEGIKRAIESAKLANIRIIMFDKLENISKVQGLINNGIGDEDISFNKTNTIFVLNKIDLANNNEVLVQNAAQEEGSPLVPIKVSVKKQVGLEELLRKIEEIAANMAGMDDAPQITRERHRHQLKQAMECLDAFSFDDIVLAAEDVRMAIRALSNVTGKITVDEILGEIFSKFCIGK